LTETNININPSLKHLFRDESLMYSVNSSGAAFICSLPSLGYRKASTYEIVSAMKRVHKKFPKVEWLNMQVQKAGLIATSKIITPTSAKGSVYLHFLAIAGLLDISFYDYFCTNPTSIGKLDRWLTPSKGEIGVTAFDQALAEVASKTENREINLARQSRLANRVGIYLTIRYHLDSLRSLTVNQWQEFMADCREHSRTTADGYHLTMASVTLMHTALFNMGILESPYNRSFGGVKSIEKSRSLLETPGFGAFATTFLAASEASKAKGTVYHYVNALEDLHEYLVNRHGDGFRLAALNRSDVVEFITSLFLRKRKDGLSDKWLESRCLCTKVFLRYISENAKAFEHEGHQVFKKKVLVDADFRVPTILRLPRPIEKDLRDAFVYTLQNVSSVRYRLAFLLMLTTGLAQGDAMCLKNDCMTYDKKTDCYTMYIWRRKVKKEGRVKLLQPAPSIIEKIRTINTQQVPVAHPDGTYAIYLFNDAGTPMGGQWFDYWLRAHKEVAAANFPELASLIQEITSHQLRHTFASMLRESGADIMQIKELLLHENINTTFKYTKENDSIKIELAQKLINGQYTCDAYPTMDQQFLQSEQGQEFLMNLTHFENRFTFGRCTVNGHENCKHAYRCLVCTYLCTTQDDLPEILSSIRIQHLQYKELSFRIMSEKVEKRIESMNFELERMKNRLRALIQKVTKLQKIIQTPAVEPSVNCDDVLTFV